VGAGAGPAAGVFAGPEEGAAALGVGVGVGAGVEVAVSAAVGVADFAALRSMTIGWKSVPPVWQETQTAAQRSVARIGTLFILTSIEGPGS